MDEQREIRISKLDKIRKANINPYPEKFEINYELKEVANLEDGTEDIKVAGRITAIRTMGKVTFINIQDVEGRIQLFLKEEEVSEEKYTFFHEIFDIGDFIGAYGSMFTTKTGEKSIRVKEYTFLGKCFRPLPEKWHGIHDVEIMYRQRYLDLVMSKETRDRFVFRSKLVSLIRKFLEERGFMEVDTPTLVNKPSGALARPFITHHNTLDIDVYLRIAPETYLKRLIVGGFTNVFEIARCFRNEGISANHLQDFTMIEGYSAYWNYEDNMKMLKELIQHLIKELFGEMIVTIEDKQVDFSQDWPIVTFRDLILKDAGIDIDLYDDAKCLLNQIKAKNIHLEVDNIESLGRGNLIDALYKKVSRPQLINPVFLTQHPLDLSPLARKNDQNPNIVDRFQLVVNGVEIINAYSELVDPIDQTERFIEQAKLNAAGDEEAMVYDEDYVTAMEYGMPPISGWGMGIDRLVQLLLNCDNIKDTVLFPLLRPLHEQEDEDVK